MQPAVSSQPQSKKVIEFHFYCCPQMHSCTYSGYLNISQSFSPESRRGCVKSKSAGMQQEYTVFCPAFQLVNAVHNLWPSGKQAAYWQQLDEELHVGRWIQVILIWSTPQIWQKVPLGLRQSWRSPVLLPVACVSPQPVILTAAGCLRMCGLSRAMSQHNRQMWPQQWEHLTKKKKKKDDTEFCLYFFKP